MISEALATLVAVQEAELSLGILAVVMAVLLMTMWGGLAVLFAKFYRKPPPDHALIRTGQGGPRAVNGSGIWIIPIVHCADLLSLAPFRIDLTGSKLDSEAARSQQLPNVFQVAVQGEHDMILTAANRLLSMPSEDKILLVKDIVLDEFERVFAQESEYTSQGSPANRFIEGVERALSTVGLTIVACRRQ